MSFRIAVSHSNKSLTTGTVLCVGTLSQPLIINERVVPDEEGHAIGNGISGVPSTCPANQAD